MSTLDRQAAGSGAAGGAPRMSIPAYSHRQILLIMSGLGMGLLLSSLDQTIVSTALTTISSDFHRLDLYSWVITSYLLTSTASTPLYGKISDQFGRKRIFQISILIFLAGSILSGLSQSMYELIAFRGVQGLGAGGLITLAFAIMGDVVAPRERGRYQGYFGAVFAVSSVVGPLAGGFLVDQASWRWIFYINLPVGAAALFVINRVLKMDHKPKRSRIDVAGSLLLVGGVSLFLVGVQMAGASAHLTALASAYGGAGVILVAAFVWWERRAAEPIVPLQLFRLRVFTVANTLGFITGSVMFGAVIFVPLFMQSVQGVSPTVSGLRMIPMLAGVLLTSITSGRAVSRIGRYKAFVVVGTAVLAVGVGLLTLITVGTSVWVLSGMLFVVGLGMGLFMQITVLAVQNSIPFEHMGVGTASVTFFRTLGGAIGAAVVGAVLILEESSAKPHFQRLYPGGGSAAAHHAFVYGMTHAFFYVLPVTVVSFLLSLALPETRLRSSSDGPGAAPGHGGPAEGLAVESMIG